MVERLYAKANKSFVESREFINRVQETVTQVRLFPARMFIITRDLFAEIKAFKMKDKPKSSPQPLVVDLVGDEPSDGEDNSPATGQAENSEPAASESVQEKKGERKPSTRQIARLEEILGAHNKEIIRYEQMELSLDDMDNEDSSYLIVERLKSRAAKIYKRICVLKGRSTEMGGTREKKFKYSGSRYKELNIHVQRFVNKHSLEERMPDYSDIRKIVKLCNDKYSYRLNERRIVDLSKEVRLIFLIGSVSTLYPFCTHSVVCAHSVSTLYRLHTNYTPIHTGTYTPCHKLLTLCF